MTRAVSQPRFACLRVEAPAGPGLDRAIAEAFEAGASGLEERELSDAVTRILLVYAPWPRAEAVALALAGSLLPEGRVGPPEAVPDEDWSLRWRQGLRAIVIGPRLAVRPSFVRFEPEKGQAEIVIDPGQAFGTGDHASTRLALELLCALPPAQLRGARVLDAGTGSGVLALAALRLGAQRALGFDLDPRVAAEARANARRNGLADRLDLVTGPVEALAPVPFDLVLANLLRRELVPLLPALVCRTRTGSRAILSGLLAEELGPMRETLARAGLRVSDCRTRRSEQGGEEWLGILTTR